MLEEILLFHSTYSEQLLLDATLIGSTDPIQPYRDGKSHLCSFQDTPHWQSNPSENRQYPSPPAHPTGRVLGWDWCFSWHSGGSLWEVPVQEGIHSCQNDPQIPKENPLEGRGVHHGLWAPGVTVPPKLRGPCCRWGGHPLAHVFLPAVPAWPGGRQAFVLPPRLSYCRWLRGNLEPGKTEHRFGMCCGAPATYPWPPPSSGQGRSSCALHLHYTPNMPKKQCHNNLCQGGGTKPTLGEAGAISAALRVRSAHHTRAAPGLKSARTARSTPPSPPHTASRHKHQRPARRLVKVQQKALPKGISLAEKAAKERLVRPKMHRLAKGRELLWAAPGRQPGGKPCPCVSIQKLQNQLVTLYYIYCP